jgi:hypothetical protein
MSARGVHFAITAAERDRLLALAEDKAKIEFVQSDIEGPWNTEFLAETDKAWDAIHRCLTEHPARKGLDPSRGEYPWKLCILGGRRVLDSEYRYIIRLIEANEVKDIAKALAMLDRDAMNARYNKHCEGAWPEFGEEDREYTWSYFARLRDFFTRVAPTGRCVIFTVDQ